MTSRLSLTILVLLASITNADDLPTADGFRGIWYSNGKIAGPYAWKYSGGMATYPQQHAPIAIYSRAAHKTFFVYGGVAREKPAELLHMIAYFDHKTGEVSRPRILLNKKTDDAHDNPTLSMDEAGHLYIFSNAHGTSRPSYIHRSAKPRSIEAFDKVWEGNFSYGQPWHVPNKGFALLHTGYVKGVRLLNVMTSADGKTWSDPMPLAQFGGHYQISWRAPDGRLATAFDFHPQSLDKRTNLYYLESADAGKTWSTASGDAVELPLKTVKNPALVKDYQAEGLLVYLKDITFDKAGRPVILFLTSKGHIPGPEQGPHTWRIARFDGNAWLINEVTTSDHNYDHGSLYVEGDIWHIIAPTDAAAQPFTTGGRMVLWTSEDAGQTWKKSRVLTPNATLNHTYARRPVDAHPDFRAIWADGDPIKRSASSIYFTNKSADAVWRLPEMMEADLAKPEKLAQ